MRKIIVVLLTLALVLSLAVTAVAAEEELQIVDVPVQEGQTVYVTVVLNTSVVGDAIGVTYSYDKAVLEAIPSSATWGKQGLLQDFSRDDSGVWAAAEAEDLKGTICVLAFRVKPGVTLTKTAVSCTVTIKNDTEKMGAYTAEGSVYATCSHSFGQWESQGELSHSRKCSLCGDTETQTHTWDDGVLSDHPSDSALDVLTFTCDACGTTSTREIADQGGKEEPTMPPAMTEAPTEPEYETMPPVTQPPVEWPGNQNPGNQNANGNQNNTGHQNTGNQNTSGNQSNSGSQNTSGNQSNSGSQNTSGNKDNTGTQNNTGNQTGSGNLTDFNQGSSGNQSNTGNQHTSGNHSGQTGSSNQSDSDAGSSGQDEHGHDHSGEEGPQGFTQPPMAVPAPNATQAHDHTHEEPTPEVHDHSYGEPAGEQTSVSLLALLFAVALVAVAAGLTTVLLKRLKRK